MVWQALGALPWEDNLHMTTSLKIDFVPDVSCPWCAIGLGALEQALAQLDGAVRAQLHCQPFELNPHMGPGGQDITEHLTEKYGSTAEQQTQARDMIRQRGAEVGFAFNTEGPVSYTHLDVYKRQAQGGGAGQPRAVQRVEGG